MRTVEAGLATTADDVDEPVLREMKRVTSIIAKSRATIGGVGIGGRLALAARSFSS